MSLRKANPLLILLIFCLTPSAASSRALSWFANPENDVAGYRIYFRTAHDSTPTVVDVGLNTSATIPGIIPETKYFVSLTAYNIHGLESTPSPEVSFYSSPRTPQIRLEGTDIVLNVKSNSGSTLDLYESVDLKSWEHIDTIIATEDELDLRLLRDPEVPKKFYRLGWSGDSYDGWLSTYASSGEGSFADSSFLVYASGADLAEDPVPGSLAIGAMEMQSSASNETVTHRTLSFRIREGARDIHARIETSSDGINWIPGAPLLAEVSSDLNGDGTRTVVYRELQPASEVPEGQREYRVTYTQTILPEEWSFSDWLEFYDISDPDSPYPGLSNDSRYAYASGADLLFPARKALPRLVKHRVFLEGSWQTLQTIEFTVRDKLMDFVPKLQVSYDLKQWVSANASTFPLSNQANGDGTRTLVFQNISNPGEPTRRFYRVIFQPADLSE